MRTFAKGGISNFSGLLSMLKRFNVIIMRIAVFVYWIYLSILLLSRDPTYWIGSPGHVPGLLKILMPFAHILSFAVLSLLTFAACLPLPRWSIILSLAMYGVLTEIIQGFFPPRTPEWADWFQDLGGVAIGFACFWLVVFLVRTTKKNETLEVPGSS